MRFFQRQRLGIDLGSTSTVIYIENKGVALREPSVIVRKQGSDEVVATGKDALALVGKVSDTTYDVVYPIQNGVMVDFDATKELLTSLIKKALRYNSTKLEVTLSVPTNLSKVERRALIDALKNIGISRAMLVEGPLVAALGSNLMIDQPIGHLVVDIGGGTLDVAAISYGEIIASDTNKFGLDQVNQIIQDLVREQYHLIISPEVAEELKVSIGNAQYTPDDENDVLQIKGQSVATSMMSEAAVSSKLVSSALNELVEQAVLSIRGVLERIKPELVADISEQGIILTGGGALVRRLPERLHDEIGIPVHIAPAPLDCIAIGTGKLLKELDRQSRIAERRQR